MRIMDDRIVVTGLGLVTSLGLDRETSWRAIQRGETRSQRVVGMPYFPDGELLAARVDLEPPEPGMLKVIPMTERAAAEALDDARVRWTDIDATRFGCSISAHMGDTRALWHALGDAAALPAGSVRWTDQWFPNTACAHVANRFGLTGPRMAHSTACASSLVSVLVGARMIRDGQCDAVLAGGGDSLNPLFCAGFRQLGVLAQSDDPATACRPFDRNRCGFILGEGAALLVLERERHALARGARIYAEFLGGHMLAEAHHVTGLDAESDALCELIRITLRKAGLDPTDVGYINAHGTATEQNDRVEMRAIRSAFGSHCQDLCVSSTKSMLGHLVNGSGAVELAVTLLAMRDGFAPPTINVRSPDPECSFDCLPIHGRKNRFQQALKLSVAFGGHLVAAAMRRWNRSDSGFAYPGDGGTVERAARAA
ncbi:MAG: beta-ketoacyl-[acyl-carrier-protein] synthase family protein [Planctomycetes bacterium]|nr:beta-ketoacyl-[acyl-carrier-protein] synthase family protein [Planctomycetota bacterium]